MLVFDVAHGILSQFDSGQQRKINIVPLLPSGAVSFLTKLICNGETWACAR